MKSNRLLKNPQREKRIFFFRAILAGLITLTLSAVLLVRMYHLQVVEHDHYRTLSDKNRMQLRSVAPNRGLIYDRNGVLLADNLPIFSVAVVKERIQGSVDETLARVAALVEITDEQIERFKKRLKQTRRFRPVILKSKLTEAEIARLAVNKHLLPGVEVEAELVRHYPFAAEFSHVLGYVGRINEKELKKVDAANYSATNYIGKSGIEKFYEDALHGQVGYQTVETNASNRVLRVLEQVDPIPGEDLYLTIDNRLQQKATALLEGKRGAIVAIQPATGEILAMVSMPSFDPNLFVTGIDVKSYAALRDSLDLPLFNRAIRGRYPPGSTIKPMVGLAGLDTGTINRRFSIWDPGYYQLKNDKRLYRDWKRGGHGLVNLKTAIAESCDTFFYELAYKLGVDKMSLYLSEFGFGQSTTADISEARSGILPSRAWKQGARGRPWYPGDSLNMGIGQGFMLATPLQLATSMTLIANRGKWHRPHLRKNGKAMLQVRDDGMQDIRVNNPDDWEYIVSAMEEVMHGRHGTARRSGRKAEYRMAGKTGTAQVVGIAQGEKYDAEALEERHRDHALFVGFAPIDEPEIAVAVIVENGGGGSHAAAPLAREMFDAWILDLNDAPDEGNGSNVQVAMVSEQAAGPIQSELTSGNE